MSTELFERDYVAWLAEQAAAMRRLQAAGANVPLDLELLAEELDDMARDLRASCASHTATIIQHLLKLQFPPAEEPRRGWQNTVRTARDNLANRITTTIANELEDDLDRRYQLARRMAQADLEQYHEVDAAKRLPRRCPYTLAQIQDAEWWPARAVVTA
jgi:hypothetical protein